MAYVQVPDDYKFGEKFSTWIIAFCPDTDSWFVTMERYFYYEYERKFESEEEGIHFFKTHPEIFMKIEIEMGIYRPSFYKDGVWLENTSELVRVYAWQLAE